MCLLRKTMEEKEQISSKMDESRNTADRVIEEVRAKLKSKTEEWNGVRNRLDDTLKMHKSAIKDIDNGRLLLSDCQKRLSSSCESIEVLSTLTSSYIRGLYEHCIVQENILPLLEESPPPDRPAKISEGNLALVMERLNKKIESAHVDWDSVLMDDKDRRQIFGNLNNRMQMNLSDINRFIAKIRRKHEVEMRRKGEDNALKELNVKKSYEVQLCKVDEQKIQLRKEFYNLSNQHEATKKDLEETCTKLEKNMREGKKKKDIITGVEKQLSELHEERDNIFQQLQETRQTLNDEIENLTLSEIDVANRDEAINQLEKILQKATSRYAAKIEEERTRLETNMDMGVHARPDVNNFGQQVDFVLASTTRPGLAHNIKGRPVMQ